MLNKLDSYSNGAQARKSETTSHFNDVACFPWQPEGYTNAVQSVWRSLQMILDKGCSITLDGVSLNLSSIVAVAKQSRVASDSNIAESLPRSVALLDAKLNQGIVIFGVNTGFGGSADTRSKQHEALQLALLQHHQAGVLLLSDGGTPSTIIMGVLGPHNVPFPIVRASMLARCNSLLRGHLGVCIEVIERILDPLRCQMTLIVPFRVLEGNPDIHVHCGDGQIPEVVPADQALQRVGLTPLRLGPKEGLGLLNGTSFSCGAASLVLIEANQLALPSQVLTAMGTEALSGSRGNFHSFIANVRPHPGQKEVASNIYALLADSKLISGALPKRPQIENLALAMSQIQCELNSTTDNPVFDPEHGEAHHGGNFRAMAITSAMIFSQCSEVLNPVLSHGLSPNLCADDPSLSFALKGVDINMASYMSELAYLTHPVSSHVQSTEIHNQSLNSLAFIAARYAAESIEVLSLMPATYLYVLCQALDCAPYTLNSLIEPGRRFSHEQLYPIQTAVWDELMSHWVQGSTKDLSARSQAAAAASSVVLLDLVSSHCGKDIATRLDLARIIIPFKEKASNILYQNYTATREEFFCVPATADHLCGASSRFYRLVRRTLAVPMNRGLADHPTYDSDKDPRATKTIGSHISTIYTELRQGGMTDAVVNCWESL
ncbi:aromatic amino acid ammonia-lyase [Aspergillus alliaceus]|uniref:aromatic amino acid ammonia-lyase n=1 Tax=Petromyces alliaceus TaxID=209559 RepID=UPI0012A6BA47|nr:L-Aspartase-like protein [Aspergillus alliaceus]KAB8229699.1 L-Aspartase-like protein [Aspergillus alliaceus]